VPRQGLLRLARSKRRDVPKQHRRHPWRSEGLAGRDALDCRDEVGKGGVARHAACNAGLRAGDDVGLGLRHGTGNDAHIGDRIHQGRDRRDRLLRGDVKQDDIRAKVPNLGDGLPPGGGCTDHLDPRFPLQQLREAVTVDADVGDKEDSNRGLIETLP